MRDLRSVIGDEIKRKHPLIFILFTFSIPEKLCLNTEVIAKSKVTIGNL